MIFRLKFKNVKCSKVHMNNDERECSLNVINKSIIEVLTGCVETEYIEFENE